MRLLITGGAGFIGSHLAVAACAAGHAVGVLDNLSTGRRSNVPSGATFHRADVRNNDEVRRVFKRFAPTVVAHMAAQSTVASSMRDPLHDAEVNVLGSVNIVNQAALQGVKRVVFAASGGTAYDIGSRRGCEAGKTPTHPISPYGCSKLSSEIYVRAFASLYGFRCAILRYANVYGPRQDPASEGGVVATFVTRMIGNRPVLINSAHKAGDGGCIRDYVYVVDVVRANLAAIKGAFDGRIVDVGTGVGTNTLDLAKKIAREVGTRPKITFGPPRTGDLPRSVLNCRHIEPVIGAHTPLREGLKVTVRWFSRMHSASRNAS